MRKPTASRILTALLLTTSLSAQTQFEVASIKPNHSGPRPTNESPFALSPGGRFTATNVTLFELIVSFYGTRRVLVQGAPPWANSDRFDIVAKGPDGQQANLNFVDVRPTVQALLQERFHLALHKETKPMQVLALIRGKEALKLEPATGTGDTVFRQEPGGRMTVQRMTTASLANTLSNMLQMPVVDRTGLTGIFNFTLDPGPVEGTEAWIDRLIAAVQDQLGLTLERQKAPIEVTIIDRAERPTQN